MLYIALVLSAHYTLVVGIITRGFTTHMRQMSNSIKLLSANCQGLGDNTKCVDVLNYLDQLKCDITCLQDTHWIERDIKKIKNLWPGEVLLSGFKRNSRGVAILLKKTFEFTIMDTYSDNSGNLLVVDLKTLITLNREICFCHLCPMETEKTFFAHLIQMLKDLHGVGETL